MEERGLDAVLSAAVFGASNPCLLFVSGRLEGRTSGERSPRGLTSSDPGRGFTSRDPGRQGERPRGLTSSDPGRGLTSRDPGRQGDKGSGAPKPLGLASRDRAFPDGGASAEIVLLGVGSRELGRLGGGGWGLVSFRRRSMQPGWRESGTSSSALSFGGLASNSGASGASSLPASLSRRSMLPGWRDSGPLGVAPSRDPRLSRAGIFPLEGGRSADLPGVRLCLETASLGTEGCRGGGKENREGCFL